MFVLLVLKLDVGQVGGGLLRLGVREEAVPPPELRPPGDGDEGRRRVVGVRVRRTVGRNVRQDWVERRETVWGETRLSLHLGMEARVADVVDQVVVERIERRVLGVGRGQILHGASPTLGHGRLAATKFLYLVFCFGDSLHRGASSCNIINRQMEICKSRSDSDLYI